jgi:putative endonuclease
MKYVVYILYCSSDQTRYVGQTENLVRRMDQHFKGKVQYTKTRKPLKLIYTKKFSNREQAVEHEKYLKSRSGRRQLSKIL